MTPWWRELMGWVLRQWRGVIAIALTTIVSIGLTLIVPWPVKIAIDSVLGDKTPPLGWAWVWELPGAEHATGLLVWLGILAVGLFAAGRLVHMFQGYLKARVGTRMSVSLGESIMDRILHGSAELIGGFATGDIVRRVTRDAHCVRDMFLGVCVPLVASGLTLVMIFVVVWRIDGWLTLAAFATAVPMLWVIRKLSGPMAEAGYEQAQEEGRLMAVAERNLSSIAVVQSFAQEDREHRAYGVVAGDSLSAYMKTLATQLWFTFGVKAVTIIGTGMVFVLAGYRAIHGDVGAGDVYLFLAYLAALYSPLESLAYLTSGVAEAKARGRRVLEILHAPDTLPEPTAPAPRPDEAESNTGAAIRLDDVTAGYGNDRPVLTDVNLDIRAGSTVALVGPSGVGKTTVAALVTRRIDPKRGKVVIDGIDARDLTLRSLRSRMAWVPQDPVFLPGTIAENLRLGAAEATDDQLVEAAKRAGAHGFIERLNDGYETRLGTGGTTLSGGQAQRLSVARALVCSAPITIFDEPTSALDAETEATLVRALRECAGKQTMIVIAHRLSTVRWADTIVVLKDGTIAEQGSFDELMDSRGEFHRLYTAQFPDAPTT